MTKTQSCGCRCITHDCSEKPNCRWLARAKTATGAAAPKPPAPTTLTDVQIDQLAADVAHTMPRPGTYLLTVPMLRKIIDGALARQAAAPAP